MRFSIRLKTSSLDFPAVSFSWLAFVIYFKNNTISFLQLHVFHVIFIKIMEKNKELIFLAQGTHHGISLSAKPLSWLVLVISFNNNNYIVIQFLFPSTCLLCDFHQKMAKNKGLLFSAQTTHHAGVVKELHWAVAAKSWRGSCGHGSLNWLTCPKLQPCKVWCFCPLCIVLS